MFSSWNFFFFVGIQFKFRTSQRNGLLFFAASEGRQEEFVTIYMRESRIYFSFDTQGKSEVTELRRISKDSKYLYSVPFSESCSVSKLIFAVAFNVF